VARRRLVLAVFVALLGVGLVHCPQVTSGPDIGCSQRVGPIPGRPFPELLKGTSVILLTIDESAAGVSVGAAFYSNYQPDQLGLYSNINQLNIGDCNPATRGDGGPPSTVSDDLGTIQVTGLASPVNLTFHDGTYVADRTIDPTEVRGEKTITFNLLNPPPLPMTQPPTPLVDPGKVDISFPDVLTLNAPANGATVSSASDLLVSWSGDPGQFLIMTLRSSTSDLPVYCRTLDRIGGDLDAGIVDGGATTARSFTVPSAVLQKGTMTLEVTRLNAVSVDQTTLVHRPKLGNLAGIGQTRRSVTLQVQ
jgi:hypothetical protein